MKRSTFGALLGGAVAASSFALTPSAVFAGNKSQALMQRGKSLPPFEKGRLGFHLNVVRKSGEDAVYTDEELGWLSPYAFKTTLDSSTFNSPREDPIHHALWMTYDTQTHSPMHGIYVEWGLFVAPAPGASLYKRTPKWDFLSLGRDSCRAYWQRRAMDYGDDEALFQGHGFAQREVLNSEFMRDDFMVSLRAPYRRMQNSPNVVEAYENEAEVQGWGPGIWRYQWE